MFQLKGGMRNSYWPGRCVLGLMAGALCGDSEDKGESAPVFLLGPEVIKADWDTRSLQTADLNGDGLMDLAVINNSRSRIDIFLQQPEGETVAPIQRSVRRDRWEPVLEDARFRRESVSVRGQVFALLLADVNGDGLPDLIYTGADPALTIRYQLAEGGFSSPVTYNRFEALPWISTLAVARLGSEKVPALVVLAKEKLIVFQQSSEGLEFPPTEYLLTGSGHHGLTVRDVDGDGRTDILYLGESKDERLRLRRQLENGSFGPEYAFPSRFLRGVLVPLPEIGGQEGLFAVIEEANREIAIVSIESGETREAVGERSLLPEIFPVLTGDGRASYALGQFHPDGRWSLVVADPGKPTLSLYPFTPGEGFDAPIDFPSLAGVTGLFRLRQGGEADRLVVFSRSENYVGLSAMDVEGRLTFPVPLRVEGEPMAVGVGGLAPGDESDGLVMVLRNGKNHHWAVITADDLRQGKMPAENGGEIAEVRRPPENVVLVDLNGDGQREVILLTPREGARVFQREAEGVMREVAVGSSVRRSLLNDIGLARLSVVGAGEPGESERMVVAGKGFARMVGMDEAGDLVIFDQFNALRGRDEVFGPLVFDYTGDGRRDVFLHQPEEGSLQWIRQDDDGVFRHAESLRVGEISLVEAPKELPDGSLFFGGADRFWRVPVGSARFTLETHAGYETDLRKVAHSLLAGGRMTKGDSVEIVAVDGSNHVLELLSMEPDFRWTSQLHFPVFERNMHFRGRQGSAHEPREIILTDLTGNGRDDLVLLVHDRILCYFLQD